MEVRLDRRAAVAALLAPRHDLFVVSGLGSTTYDVASLGDDARNFYLWGAMGGAAMIGLGLALARPSLRIAVITGDGEMLMGLGSLATIGVQQPKNLAVIVFDNGHYGETGMQASHTGGQVAAGGQEPGGGQVPGGGQASAGSTDLCAVARACGFTDVHDVTDAAALRRLGEKLAGFDRTLFARVRIAADEPPRVLPTRDGVELKLRFRRAVAAAGE
jgi:thiamine pyrophosphate-dependent acetolactate synthase large subunit-like protein